MFCRNDLLLKLSYFLHLIPEKVQEQFSKYLVPSKLILRELSMMIRLWRDIKKGPVPCKGPQLVRPYLAAISLVFGCSMAVVLIQPTDFIPERQQCSNLAAKNPIYRLVR